MPILLITRHLTSSLDILVVYYVVEDAVTRYGHHTPLTFENRDGGSSQQR